jgi:hypothetical protein
MQAIYQMCATESNVVFAACQPDSTILKWPMPLDGDFNLDGVVDNLDKAIWFANAFTGTTWAQGDANGDGVVNGLDRDILYANMGRSIFTEYPNPAIPSHLPPKPGPAPGPTPTPQPVPTPAPNPVPLPTPKNPTPVGTASSASTPTGATTSAAPKHAIRYRDRNSGGQSERGPAD